MNKQSYRHLIAEITKLFFRSKDFKIFEVFPEGWFISLGLTTSFETLEKLKNVFRNSDYDFKEVTLAELESTRNRYGTYDNIITKTWGLEKYSADETSKEGCIVLGKDHREEYPQLAKIIESSEGSWNEYAILISPDKDPVIYYKKINYKRVDDDTELRIGIYVVPEVID